MKDFNLVITDWDGAGKFLKENQADWAMSFGNPKTFPPRGLPDRTLRLEFFDIRHDVVHNGKKLVGPNRQHVESIIEFCHKIDGGTVLVHCMAGISRSTAAAVILMAMKMGPGHEADAMRVVYEARHCATPNRTMIEIADQLLARDGALIDAVDAHTSPFPDGDPSRLWTPSE